MKSKEGSYHVITVKRGIQALSLLWEKTAKRSSIREFLYYSSLALNFLVEFHVTCTETAACYDDVKVYVLVYDGGYDFLYIGLFIWDVIIYLVILLRNDYFQQLDSSLYIASLKKVAKFLLFIILECTMLQKLSKCEDKA